MNTIVGADISDNNGQINWPTFKNNVNFCLMKATEGTGYIDKWFAYNWSQARAAGLLRGVYHFARPDLGNKPEDEAQFFINVIKGQGGLQQGESVYLDYEKPLTVNNVVWALTWLQIVEAALGVKPLFYTYQSMINGKEDWSAVVNNGNALWIAAPTNDPANNTFQTGKWPSAVIQQWGNQNIPGAPNGVTDSDIFFGTSDQFLAYGLQIGTPVQAAPVPPSVPPPAGVTSAPPPAAPAPAQTPTSTLASSLALTLAKSKNFEIIALSKFFNWNQAQMTDPNAGREVVGYIESLSGQIEALRNKLQPFVLQGLVTDSAAAPQTPATTQSPTTVSADPNGGGGAQLANGTQATADTTTPSAPAGQQTPVSPAQQSAAKQALATFIAALRVIFW